MNQVCNIKDNCKIVKDKALVHKFGRMERSIKALGILIKQMGKEF